MSEKYYVWSCRLQGWFTLTANYSTDRKVAKPFTEEEAIAYCRHQYKDGLSEFGLLPVSETTLERIASK